MSKCLKPLVAVSLCEVDGKKKIKFISQEYGVNLGELRLKYGDENVFLLPCGACDSCRKNYAQEWAVRCSLESLYHKHGYFITLTYDDLHLQFADRRDFKRFIENIRHKDKNLKFFACSEKGELTGRLHYHLILLTDYDFNLYDCIKKGTFYHYHSKVIDDYWSCGLHDISEFDFACSSYVAKYTTKDSNVFMSKNIGKSYFDEHYREIAADGFKIYEKFGNKSYINIPRCFVRWYADTDVNVDLFSAYLKKLTKDINCHLMSSCGFHQEEAFYLNDVYQIKKKKRGVRDVCLS